MIRDRRDEDLERLCMVLETMNRPANLAPGQGFLEWLTEHDAERSWVFDQAPVTVAPTKNVVAHVQIYRPADELSGPLLMKRGEQPAAGLMVIGRLFVRPGPHSSNIARYSLAQSVKHIEGRGRVPVLQVRESAPLPTGLLEKLGFTDVGGSGT